MHIKEADIMRFTFEVNSLDWSPYNSVFLDEVSFDNCGMVRKWATLSKGKSYFILENYSTEGTFDWCKFIECCRKFVLESDHVKRYPGANSIWILDGAAIHQSAELIMFLCLLGIVPLFLPAYCPFFNPIEVMLGLSKKRLHRIYPEGRVNARNLGLLVAKAYTHYCHFDFRPIFRHYGFVRAAGFNPTISYESKARSMGFI
ncbi:hypothetical protein CcCBS67573_g10474 [Chytriomyces confervae]|uniref:Tc1-like transposase DDE domain-containing protein n=1 Tax=Chytriomyces confervae TaxID=246404 RepID=A0A507CV91_9FUNG|nr:hypothetical protein CcCBS67573_g10474 [Chytriomyces confervae]